MRFLADESCDFSVVVALRAAGHDVSAMVEIQPGAEDSRVLALSHAESRVLLTEDKDFGVLVATHRTARLDRLIYGEVRYWSPEDPPREIWAFPHLLTMHKHKSHESDQEYRFAFGTRADVFDFENVFGLVVPPGYVFPRIELDAQAHRMKLYLGKLADCCRIRE